MRCTNLPAQSLFVKAIKQLKKGVSKIRWMVELGWVICLMNEVTKKPYSVVMVTVIVLNGALFALTSKLMVKCVNGFWFFGAEREGK